MRGVDAPAAIRLAGGEQPQRRAAVADVEQQRQRQVVAQDAVLVDAVQLAGLDVDRIRRDAGPRVREVDDLPELERIVYRCITVPGYGLQDLRADLEEFIGKA